MNESIYSDMSIYIDEHIASCLKDIEIEQRLNDSARYMLFPGGKRFRPKLLLSICVDFVGRFEEALSLAAAVEFLHVASLIHDDLPALDNDDFRRGRPSCHRAFDEATAILVGDALISLSFASAARFQGKNSNNVVPLLSKAFICLCAGQARDLKVPEAEDEIVSMFDLKTGHLLGACAALGAISAGRSDSDIQEWYAWGRQLGVAFQIADDMKDRFGSNASRGRPESSDARNKKAGLFASHTKDDIQMILTKRLATLEDDLNRLLGTEPGADHKLTLDLIKQQFAEYTAHDLNFRL
jgi:geranylgeranyl diphosphate synthase type II